MGDGDVLIRYVISEDTEENKEYMKGKAEEIILSLTEDENLTALQCMAIVELVKSSISYTYGMECSRLGFDNWE